MKVLLLNPSRAGKGNIPVNLPVLYSVLMRAGHDVRVFDFSDYLCFQTTIQDGSTECGSKSNYNQMFFKETEEADSAMIWQDRQRYYQQYGNEWVKPNSDRLLRSSNPHTDLDELCAQWRPHVVGVSCLTVDFPSTIDFLISPKQKYGFHCVFGGIHAITLPDHAISPDLVDSICIGEGEGAFLEFLDRFASGAQYWKTFNMWVKHDGKIHKNPLIRMTDMADLPYMEFDGFDPVHFYRPFDGKLYRMLNYEWGRGCPYRCTYCENVVLNDLYKRARTGKKIVRHKPPEKSIAELEYLIKKYNFNFIRFWDEDFTAVGLRELEAYAELYKERIGLPFLIYSRTESISEKKVKILADMGCVTFAIGIESGSEFIRRTVLDRQLSNRQIIDKLKVAKKLGIRVSGYNIIGLPRENRERIFETIKLNRAAPIATSSCTLLEPYPATPIRTLCEEEGLPKEYYPNYDSFKGRAQFIPKSMTREKIEGLFKTFSLYVHLPRYLFPLIEMAEKETPEGRKVFKALLQMKKEHFMDKPSYADEDNFEEVSNELSFIEKPPAIPDCQQAAKALLNSTSRGKTVT